MKNIIYELLEIALETLILHQIGFDVSPAEIALRVGFLFVIHSALSRPPRSIQSTSGKQENKDYSRDMAARTFSFCTGHPDSLQGRHSHQSLHKVPLRQGLRLLLPLYSAHMHRSYGPPSVIPQAGRTLSHGLDASSSTRPRVSAPSKPDPVLGMRSRPARGFIVSGHGPLIGLLKLY